jgi:hypothetical protein
MTEASFPPLHEQFGSAAGATGRALAAAVTGQPVIVSQAEQDRRLKICAACPAFRPAEGRCGVCGCRMRAKTRLTTEGCPLDSPRW